MLAAFGAVNRGVVGGLAGKGIAESIDLTVEDIPLDPQLPPNFGDAAKSREHNASRPIRFPSPIARFTTTIKVNLRF
jgi:hypothetical protein